MHCKCVICRLNVTENSECCSYHFWKEEQFQYLDWDENKIELN